MSSSSTRRSTFGNGDYLCFLRRQSVEPKLKTETGNNQYTGHSINWRNLESKEFVFYHF